MRVVGLRGEQPEEFVELTAAELELLRTRRGRGEKGRLAHKLGVTTRTLTGYEHGERRPPLGTFHRWCELLGVDFDKKGEAAQ
jgi:transcriptional regulator with XRE-family HTH domain